MTREKENQVAFRKKNKNKKTKKKKIKVTIPKRGRELKGKPKKKTTRIVSYPPPRPFLLRNTLLHISLLLYFLCSKFRLYIIIQSQQAR